MTAQSAWVLGVSVQQFSFYAFRCVPTVLTKLAVCSPGEGSGERTSGQASMRSRVVPRLRDRLSTAVPDHLPRRNQCQRHGKNEVNSPQRYLFLGILIIFQSDSFSRIAFVSALGARFVASRSEAAMTCPRCDLRFGCEAHTKRSLSPSCTE